MSSMNNNSRENMWLQQHYEQLHQIQEINPCFNSMNIVSSSGSTLNSGDALVHEAVGRRSRASRRAIPTTLLNANPSNFRALVQKFTGRSAGGESIRRKGPVTLDFGSPSTISKEVIFPVSIDKSTHCVLNPHVSCEQRHMTWSGSDQASNSTFGQDQDQDLLRECSGTSSYDDGLEHMDFMEYNDLHLETATLEEFMMRDLDL